MAESYYFFDDGVAHASVEFAQFFSLLTVGLYNDATGQCGFVLPEYDNNLEVTSTTPTVGNVKVNTGYAVVNGYLYQNTASLNVAIPSPAANPRWDKIVLRPDTVAKTVTVTRIAGTEAANPSVPAASAGDLELARIWVPGTYNAATDAVADSNIHDRRIFRPIGTLNSKYPVPENLLRNSEWLAFSGNGAANPPDGWLEVGATTSIGLGATPGTGNAANSSRVRPLIITGNAGTGISTTVLIPTPLNSGGGWVFGDRSRMVVVRGTWRIGGAGQVARLSVTPRQIGVGTATAITRELYRYSQDNEFIIYINLDATYDAIDLEFTSQAAATVITIGQIQVMTGYQPGAFEPQNEMIMFNDPVVDASWNNTAKSTGTTTVNLLTAFSASAGAYIRGAIFLMRGNDSGSAAAASCQLGVALSGTPEAVPVMLVGIANDTKRSGVVYSSVPVGDANAPVYFGVIATGAATLDATAYLLGIIT